MKEAISSLFTYSREVATNMLKPGSCLAQAGKSQGIPHGHEVLLHTHQKFMSIFSWNTLGTPTTLKITGHQSVLPIL